MIQTRLCTYLRPNCKHPYPWPTTFLDLPEDVRHRIYRDAGCISDESLHLRVKKDGSEFDPKTCDIPASYGFYFDLVYEDRGWKQENPTLEIPTFYMYHSLRLVNSAVKDDLVKYICTNNAIWLDRRGFSGTAVTALAEHPFGIFRWLRNWTIDIEEIHLEHLSPTAQQHVPTDDICKHDHCIRALEADFEYLLSHFPDTTMLSLRVWCGLSVVVTENVAERILSELNMFRFASCTVGMHESLYPELETKIRECVTHTTRDNIAAQGCFRFLELPTELRLHILSYTDLVTPDKEITWAPSDNYQILPLSRRVCSNWVFCNRESYVFPPCHCWDAPTPLFLVCKEVLGDARAIFYSSNRFIVSPPRSASKNFGHRETSFEASTFLTKAVPLEGLKHLRDLEIVFYGSGYNRQGIQQEVIDEWEIALQYAKPHLKSLSLQLSLDGGTHAQSFARLASKGPRWSPVDIVEVLEQIVRPLRQLNRLNSFSVSVSSYSSFGREQRLDPQVTKFFKDQATYLESLVMGTNE